MQSRSVIAALVLFAAASTATAAIHGAWTASTYDTKPGFLQFNVSRRNSSWGNTTDVASFSGLSASQINAATSTPVSFELRRDAGVVKFEGAFRNGDGAGHFDFAPNRSYVETLRSLGVDLQNDEDGEENALFRLAMHDVSAAFIREMQSLGYRGSIDTYVRFRIHGVTVDYVRDMASLGFKNLEADDLVRSRIHGATPQYIRDMRAAGFNGLSMDELVRSRIHGATPEFIRSMRDRGYGDLSMDDYIRFRIHGVSAEFIDGLHTLGYDKVPAEDLVRMRIHGVTPEYIREMQSAGYRNIPVEKLISMRIHGIDADFAKKANGDF
ncbi:MAG: hypothetical protein ACXVJO_16395 [Thermoanaerobaculia bacterium]